MIIHPVSEQFPKVYFWSAWSNLK